MVGSEQIELVCSVVKLSLLWLEHLFHLADRYVDTRPLEIGVNQAWLHSEGKEYVVDEGDVMEFLVNV